MAITARVRFIPDVLTDRTTVANAAPDGTTGTLFFPIQVIVYDDTVVTAGNYKAGDPATEAAVTVVHSDVVMGELASLNPMTPAQQNSWLDAQLDAWAAANKPMLNTVAPIRYRAMRRPPRAIP